MSGVKEVVNFGPNIILRLEVGSHNGKPTYSEYTYDEVIALLTRRTKSVSRRSKTGGSKASRVIALLCRAILTGKWSTGASIDRVETAKRLADFLENLSRESSYSLTSHANHSICKIIGLHATANPLPQDIHDRILNAYRGRQ